MGHMTLQKLIDHPTLFQSISSSKINMELYLKAYKFKKMAKT
jgi:hypothetical protein